MNFKLRQILTVGETPLLNLLALKEILIIDLKFLHVKKHLMDTQLKNIP